MPDDRRDSSDLRWREAMVSLGRGNPGSADLERRVRAAVAAQHPKTMGAHPQWRRVAVAAILLIALAALLFRVRSPVPGPDGGVGQQYLLLLYEGGNFAPGPVSHEELVREYSAWAGGLAAAGKLVEASELEPAEHLSSGRSESTRSPAGEITGFFIVRAMDTKEAAAIAAGCPHLKYGGEVAVRPLRVTGRSNPT